MLNGHVVAHCGINCVEVTHVHMISGCRTQQLWPMPTNFVHKSSALARSYYHYRPIASLSEASYPLEVTALSLAIAL